MHFNIFLFYKFAKYWGIFQSVSIKQILPSG